ncbi:MAG: Acetyl-CoA:oxalate CoA-transferase [Alphaproteobacteria bacterium MarineAlpha4_Bin2]|nr:MAG: Acetyl-CoA:oxalate CoA-transferase [Alphaproteobacteria bacterium MarineAlpha4_Bin2]
MNGNAVKQPFDGLRVVDLTQGLAGPYCAMLMAQNGADVIKVEPPEGDWSRRLGVSLGPERTAAYVATNRGKRAIVADLKSDEGLNLVQDLVSGSDVFMESNRAGVAERLGVGYGALRLINDDLVYLSVTGFGQKGPYADRPATDAILQAFSGLMVSNPDSDGAPRRIEFPVPDYTTGLIAYQTLVTALYGRAVNGGGCHLDVSLMQAMLLFQQQGLIAREVDPAPPHGSPVPPTGTYAAADGFINISVVREKFFKALCKVLDLPELASDPQFSSINARRKNVGKLLPPIEAAVARRGLSDLSASFAAADVPHALVNDYQAAVRDPHVAATEGVAWFTLGGAPLLPFVNVPGAALLRPNDRRARIPELDGDREEVLSELGLR